MKIINRLVLCVTTLFFTNFAFAEDLLAPMNQAIPESVWNIVVKAITKEPILTIGLIIFGVVFTVRRIRS